MIRKFSKVKWETKVGGGEYSHGIVVSDIDPNECVLVSVRGEIDLVGQPVVYLSANVLKPESDLADTQEIKR